jgi:metallophosphoesterase superfamily enzyme
MSSVTSDVPPEDVLNILVASDIHLGCAEKDSVRGMMFIEAVVVYLLYRDLIGNCKIP